MANKLKAALANSISAAPASKPPTPPKSTAAPTPKPAIAPQPVVRSETLPSRGGRADRTGTVLIGGHFESDLARRWNILAAERGVTKQELLREAIGDMLAKYNAR
jgi:hypothetical protein